MPGIRPLQADDLPEVLGLLNAHLPGWGGDERFLRTTVLEHPWADPEVTSLVAVDDGGEPIGFIGAQVRRLRYGDRQLRGVCCSHLVVAPDRRYGAAGALLLGKLLRGPQSLTWSDSVNAAVARIWQTYGGHLDHSRTCDWMLVLRPFGWLASAAAAFGRDRQIGREQIPVAAFPAHALNRAHRRSDPQVSSEDATAELIVEAMPALTARTQLWVDYDVEHLDHLFAVIRAREGELACRLVRRSGRAIGWYAYLPRRSRASRVLQLCAVPGETSAVVGELTADAYANGSRALVGRQEPHLDAALRERGAVLGLAREPALHTNDIELRATLATRASLLTQLDSEWFVT